MVTISDLAVFIPIDRREAIGRDAVITENTSGTALFADVSGFTSLTGILAREMGPQHGAEELLNYLNPVFEALIAELHIFGGVVISFAGDSITCWLDGDEGGCAIACAVSMQSVMKNYHAQKTPAGSPFSLQVKIAITSGPARRFVVGSREHQIIDVLAGQTLMRVAAAEKLAQKGEIVVESPILTILGDRVTVSEYRTDQSGLRVGVVRTIDPCFTSQPLSGTGIGHLTEDEIKSWLLRPVYERIKSGQTFLAELRPATALFVRFSGLDYDQDERAVEKLDRYVRWVQTVIYRYHGYLVQLSIGDKGSFLYICFGAPVTHGNNAILATATALDLLQGSRDYEGIYQLQIGISSGHMWSGAYGATMRKTYGVIGNDTNMAARLMEIAAPGQILVTNRLVGAAEDYYNFRDLGKIKVKGSEEPLSVFEVVGRKQVVGGGWHLFTQALVGRQDEIIQLEELLKKVVSDQGQTVRIVGDAGMGKSHLVAEFSRSAIKKGVRLSISACESITHNSPYFPWGEMIRALLELNEATDEQVIEFLSTDLAREHPSWNVRLPLLGDLLGLSIPDNATTEAFDANMRQKALISLVIEMLQTMSQVRPLLLVIENAHWMDEASSVLTQAFAQQGISDSAIMFVLIHRPGISGCEPLFSGLDRLTQYTEIHLKALETNIIHRLIQSNLGNWPSPLLLNLIQSTSRGNPLFVGGLLEVMQRNSDLFQRADGSWDVSDQLHRKLQIENLVRQVHGEWDLVPDADLSGVHLGIPDSIHELVLTQIDRLPEEYKLTLKIGSVIGQNFARNLVIQAHPRCKHQDQIQEELKILETEKIIHEQDPIMGIYAFRHRSAQEVVYETMLHAQRRDLHQIVARSLVESQPKAIPQIAQHAYLGQSWSLAMEYNLLAGQQARQVYANQQSIDFYQNALRSSEQLPEEETISQRKIIQLSLGELLVSTARYDAAYESLDEALHIAQELGDVHTQACSYRWYARAHELRGEYEPALEWLWEGFSLLEAQKSEMSLEEAELSLIAGLISIRQGDFDQAIAFCERSLRIAEQLDDSAVRARTFNLMGIVDRRKGKSDAALDRFRQSLSEYEKLGNIYGQATSHNLVANGYYMRSEWGVADEHYHRSLDMFAQIGDSYNQVLVLNNLGGIALKQGRLDDALDYYQRAITLLERTGGSEWVIGALQMNLGNTLIHRYDLDEAIARLELAEEHFNQASIRDLLPELYGLFAEATLLIGDIQKAEKLAVHSIELARELEMPCEEGHNLRILGDIAQSSESYEEAERYYLESRNILERTDDQYECAKTRLSLAGLYSKQGWIEQARAQLADCEIMFSRLDAVLDLMKVSELTRTIHKHEN